MSESVDRGWLVRKLLDVPLFENLDYTQIGEVVDIAEHRLLETGEVVCESRTIDENLVVLLDGSLRLESAEGRFLDDLEAVRVIGEMGVFTGQIRSSRVIANDGARVLMIPAAGLQDLLEEDGQLAHHLFSSLIQMLYVRLHDVNGEMQDLQEKVIRLRKRVEGLSPDDPLIAELFPE